MQIKWVYTNADGTVGIVGSAHLEDLQRQFGPEFSLDDLRTMVLRKSIPPGATAVEMPDGWESPQDRTFRNAWRGKGLGVPHPESAEITVDMPHAREIHRGWLRRKRIAKLAELDVEYQRADEQNKPNEKRTIAEQKQRLRDLPNDPRIEAAQTTDELKQITI